MRQLLLLRHGASADNMSDNEDINRPLTPHGEQQVLHMAEKLQKEGFIPERIFSSPAKRALKTAQEMAKLLGNKVQVEIQPTLYLASTADILTFIDTFPENCESMLVVGHNPGLSECAGLLAKQHVPDMKPAGICWLQWPQHETWEDIANGAAVEVKALAL